MDTMPHPVTILFPARTGKMIIAGDSTKIGAVGLLLCANLSTDVPTVLAGIMAFLQNVGKGRIRQKGAPHLRKVLRWTRTRV